MFTIADGHIDFRSRYVMNEKLRAERPYGARCSAAVGAAGHDMRPHGMPVLAGRIH